MPDARYRILAIDDVPSNLLTLRAILPETEFEVWGASGADEAFRVLDGTVFDLILLDILLPGIDGYEIARRLKNIPATASIPLIFLTALQQEDEIVKGFEAGGVDFISKPFHQAELLMRVRTHLAHKDKNEALERTASELRKANHARDQFFSILAHDLKNPFAGFLSLLGELVAHPDTLSQEELAETLQAMNQTAQRVYRLLENLLDWGRAQNGALPLMIEPQLLPFLVEEAIDPLEAEFREKNIAVAMGNLSFKVLADRHTVVAIIRNLLSNSLKYTHSGGEVAVNAVVDQKVVSVSVSDTGVGISPNRLPLLFRLENKSSTPGTDDEQGTGLGLILCAELAERNAGTLAATSILGEGTIFTLRLPVPLP